MITAGTIVGTAGVLIEQTPPNYSIIIDRLYIGNFGTTLASVELFAVPYTYTPSNTPANSTVLSSSSIIIGNFPVIDSFVAVDREDAIRFPTSSFIYAVASSGSIALTYNARYIYFRE